MRKPETDEARERRRFGTTVKASILSASSGVGRNDFDNYRRTFPNIPGSRRRVWNWGIIFQWIIAVTTLGVMILIPIIIGYTASLAYYR